MDHDYSSVNHSISKNKNRAKRVEIESKWAMSLSLPEAQEKSGVQRWKDDMATMLLFRCYEKDLYRKDRTNKMELGKLGGQDKNPDATKNTYIKMLYTPIIL